MSRIVILGAGESGAGAAVLAKKEGFDVFVSDMSKIKDKYKKLLDDHQIEWEEGHHTEEKILNANEIIKSPGIPKEAPMIQKLMAQGTPIISEIEFAARYTDAKMVCITGSNGKTTTTSLIYHIFKAAGMDAGLAGNIGNSLALQVAEEPHKYYIIELSSFQLDNMYKFRANIAILLNITPDHLDRYDFCMQNYVDAKMRITQNQTEEDSFIYWNDDPIVKKEIEKYNLKSRIGIDYKKGTLPNYQYTRLTLGLFVKKRYGTDDVAFGELDEQFIREYMDFCLDERGLALDTVRHYLAILKKTCRIAFKAGHSERYHFMHFKLPQKKENPPKALTREDFLKIRDLEIPERRKSLALTRQPMAILTSLSGQAFHLTGL